MRRLLKRLPWWILPTLGIGLPYRFARWLYADELAQGKAYADILGWTDSVPVDAEPE